MIPHSGTDAHKTFLTRSRDPNSMEAKILAKMHEDAANQVQAAHRAMLQQMIDLVPGQVFRDVGLFHEKFGLAPTTDRDHVLDDDMVALRIRFMFEELREYAEAVGHPIISFVNGSLTMKCESSNFDAAKALDGLIDLVYVACGTAFLHNFPFNEGWVRVQEANMAKERASGADDPRSTRKHAADIVKPAGWQAPTFDDLLFSTCIKCEGGGGIETGGGLELKCDKCEGTGKVKGQKNADSDADAAKP